MKSTSLRTGLLVAAALCVAPLARPHHSAAMFDLNKCESVTGTVRTFQFLYPHSWLWVDSPGAKGGEETWAMEFAAPGNLVQADARWNKSVMKKGDKVTVWFSPLRDGRKGGFMASVKLEDGNQLKIGTPACGYRFSEGRSKAGGQEYTK